MKYTQLVLLSIIISFWALSIGFVWAADPADWGDVIDVNYSLWLDEEHTIEKPGNIDVVLSYVYLRRNQNEKVPRDVYVALPAEVAADLQNVYLQSFIDAIIGMNVGENKDFMIPAEDAYGDEDLYYRIRLLKIHYDASEQPTETPSASDPNRDMTYALLIVGGIIIGGGGFIVWSVRSSRTYKSALSEKTKSSAVREKTIQKEKDQIKELRKLTESVSKAEDTATKPDIKLRRRR
ncbi:MAG: hypothetical protein ACFFB2_06710 [Promethearchaeota archaeon]